MAGVVRPASATLQPDLPAKSSQFGTCRPTRLDEIKNFHSTDSMDTQNSSTRGRLVWVHSSQVGKSVLTNGCVTLFPMNGSILLRWA